MSLKSRLQSGVWYRIPGYENYLLSTTDKMVYNSFTDRVSIGLSNGSFGVKQYKDAKISYVSWNKLWRRVASIYGSHIFEIAPEPADFNRYALGSERDWMVIPKYLANYEIHKFEDRVRYRLNRHELIPDNCNRFNVDDHSTYRYIPIETLRSIAEEYRDQGKNGSNCVIAGLEYLYN